MSEKATRLLVRERSDGLCERCGQVGHTVHHRRKRSAGGPWSGSNCVLLCGDGVRGCHGRAEHYPNAMREEGFHVRSYEDEHKIPVLRFGTFVLLRDDGTVEEVN